MKRSLKYSAYPMQENKNYGKSSKFMESETELWYKMIVDAQDMSYSRLNQMLDECGGDCQIEKCLGQRFIGAGRSEGYISISGIPGNALGAYLNGAFIEVQGNAQDAVGDTMNAGTIAVHGNIGDAVGYAMRGGEIFVHGNAGYRAGVHMKSYKDKLPVMVIGGSAGSFLGEYQAGGLIIVLGINGESEKIVSNFPCTGMHGGKVFLRSDCKNIVFPKQVSCHLAEASEVEEIRPHIEKFCSLFGGNAEELLSSVFTVVTPDSKNPYKQMYVAN